MSDATQAQRNARRTVQGIVTSAKMDKTISVDVERRFAHPKYGKFVRRNKKYHAHDETNQAAIGDVVELAATRPLSKIKRWRLVRIVEANRMAQATAAEGEQFARDLAHGTDDGAGAKEGGQQK